MANPSTIELEIADAQMSLMTAHVERIARALDTDVENVPTMEELNASLEEAGVILEQIDEWKLFYKQMMNGTSPEYIAILDTQGQMLEKLRSYHIKK